VFAKAPADFRPSDLEARVETGRESGPFLHYRDGEGQQQCFFFAPEAERVSVGRLASSDLPLEWDVEVSRVHACFERVEHEWELVDDGHSRNGTSVNGERLSGRCRLKDGDTLRFGTVTVTFRSPRSGQPDVAGAASTPLVAGLSSTQRRVLVALCRPYKAGGTLARPATDQQIADELFLPPGAVKTHLQVLCAKLGVEQLPDSETRVRLVECAFSARVISEHDL
jgi:hypothetical protein